jgi:Ca2+-binding RTX toxin-like protein
MPYLYVDDVAASEGASAIDFVVRLDAPALNQVSVNFTTLNGTAVGNSDVTGQVGTLTFAPGETSKTVHVLLLNDTVAEKTEAFFFNLSNAVSATIAKGLATGTIYDNDATAGTPGISVRDVVVDESGKTANFVVSLDKPSILPVSVNYGTADDTAVAGQDFVAANGILNFAPGEMVKTVSVNLINDAVAENDEFFKLVLTSPSAATLADATGVAMIGHNDAAPTSTPYVYANPVAVGESDVFADFVVQLSAPSQNEVRVNYTTLNGTAVGNNDVIGQVGTLVFAPGETLKVVRTLLLDDTTAEQPAGFWLSLSGAVNATIAQGLVTGTIFDNDGTTGTPGISVGDVVVDESANVARFVVSLDRASTSTVTVNYGTANDTATAGQDYQAVSGTLSFAPGEVTKTITVNLVNDSLAETDESFQMLLSNPGNATIADGIGAAMIGRSDTAPVSQPQILVNPVIDSEGDTYSDFIVQLSAPSLNEVRVNYSTANGTAVGNSDVIGQVGTLVFAPGETTKTIRLLLLNDTTVEQTEGYWLDLSGAVNATIPQTRTAGTIIDNDGATTYSYGISNDQYTVASASDRIAESVNGGIDTVHSSVSYILPDNVENLVLTGTLGLTATGNAGNNVLRGNSGNNLLDGQGGIDTAVFSGNSANYTNTAGANGSRVVTGGPDGSDTLVGIERIQFANVIQATDTSPGGNTYAAYAMFNAGFNRGPTTDELSLWTSTLDRLGGNTKDLAQTMINYYAPGVSNEVLVAYLWSTIVGGSIPADALAQYTGLVVNGTFTQASLLDFVSTLSLNTNEIVQIVGTTLNLDPGYFPPPAP